VHATSHATVFGLEAAPRGDRRRGAAEPAGEAREGDWLLGQRVDLELIDDL
jgi:hypothetical protein